MILRMFLILASITAVAQAEVPACGTCEKITTLSQQEPKSLAARSLADYLLTLKFSEDKKTKSREMETLLKATVELIDSDDRFDLPDLLVEVEKANKKEFDSAFEQLPSSKGKKSLRDLIDVQAKIQEHGEEPDPVP